MNYNFIIGKGIGDIKFDSNKNEIVRLLGKPDNIESSKGYKCDTQTFIYNNLGLRLIFDYDEFANPKKEVIVLTENLAYKNKKWNNLKKNEIFNIFKKEFFKMKYKYNYEFHDYEEDSFEEYEYEKLGLTIFFKKNLFDSAYVYKPIID